MTLTPGSRLGPYEVQGPLGAGGMGEVYRARDVTLNRDVAIKILPDLFAHDTDRVGRFTREAQTLAALNHPNIAQIYGIVEAPSSADGARGGAHVHGLVMELIEGEDLAALITRGPMPIADALPIAKQIADALEAAHEQGIIHRDLKPANIKVRPDGAVKVLDFGLAKALDTASGAGADAMNSPTLTEFAPRLLRGSGGASPTPHGYGRAGTQMGVILGTAAYMAPEQARGKAVDRRADIWAFGVVLFEMLTGRRAFPGDDISDVLASVLKSDPEWNAVPAGTPPSVRRLLRRCLEKDPRKRLSAIGDARLDLDEPDTPAATSATSGAVRPSLFTRLWPAIAGAAVTAVIAALLWTASRGTDPAGLARLSMLAPAGESLYPDSTGVAISPDGTMIAFLVGSVAKSGIQLWVRSLDSLVARRLEGGDGATLPFWSPDSRRIGFMTTDGKLKTMAASGGRAEVLCDAPNGRGAVWTKSNVILFAPDAGGPIYRIPSTGGTPTPVTKLDAARREYGHRFPALLPDGQHFLYASLPGKNGQFDIFAGSLMDDSRTFVGSMDASPVYADPGWLLFARQGVLTAQPFDAKRLTLTGDPVTLDDEPSAILDPATSFTAGRSTSISQNGALAYFSTPSPNNTAEWYDASGRKIGTLNIPAGHYETATISPDGTHAVLVRSTSPSESALWLVDLARASASPLTAGRGRNDSPVWSPDGTRIVFSADRNGPEDVFVKEVADASPEQPLYRSDVPFKGPGAWSPDGRWIVMTELDPVTAENIWLLPVPGGRELKPFVIGPRREMAGPVSPDGRWIAYVSDETGRIELYVQSFPVPGHKVQVSQAGATAAWWTRDGRQLLFIGDDLRSLWRVDVSPGATFGVGTPKLLAVFPPNIVSIDAMPDRQRFLALTPERIGTGSITVVQNWLAAVRQKR